VELGCGTGKNTDFLLKKATKIIALDFSDKMLEKAKFKIQEDRVEFRLTDLNKDWQISADFADLITANLVLEHIKNLDFIFKEANKVLKNQGYFFICELHPFKQYLGSKARFETKEGLKELQCYTHHISEFIEIAKNNDFYCVELKEWFDKDDLKEIPRLLGIVFKKGKGTGF
ncbi:MAG TPA: class I SAM-dependent methyltransferase, partial [Flavobacteriia bacterium]|nr:class I SAM-dependent methyltransferase [Flavobacteriia bacterium]